MFFKCINCPRKVLKKFANRSISFFGPISIIFQPDLQLIEILGYVQIEENRMLILLYMSFYYSKKCDHFKVNDRCITPDLLLCFSHTYKKLPKRPFFDSIDQNRHIPWIPIPKILKMLKRGNVLRCSKMKVIESSFGVLGIMIISNSKF